MNIKAYKTDKIYPGDNLYRILDKFLPELHEKEVVFVTSKIVSLAQKRVIKNDGKITKIELAKKMADYYLPEKYIKYGVRLTITNDTLIASAGIDESNSKGYFVLWPKDVLKEAESMWTYLRKKFNIEHLGVVITDSHGMILRKGLTGFGLAWCGFEPIKDYVGKPDIFGKILNVSKTNLVDGLASSAVLVMGEGSEQTPLAVASDLPFIEFKTSPPSEEEIDEMHITPENDLYSALLTSVKWDRGQK